MRNIGRPSNPPPTPRHQLKKAKMAQADCSLLISYEDLLLLLVHRKLIYYCITHLAGDRRLGDQPKRRWRHTSLAPRIKNSSRY